MIGLLGFGSVVLVAMALLHGWLWFRLPVAAVVDRCDLPYAVATPLDWMGYSWLGIAFYAFLALLALEPVRWVLRAVQRRRHHEPVAAVPTPAPWPGPEPAQETAPAPEPVGVSRRLFLARSLAVTAGVAAIGTAGHGAWAANSVPVVRRVPITIAGLAPELVGYRIVTFSDGHLSATYGGRRFERLVETVNAQDPDGSRSSGTWWTARLPSCGRTPRPWGTWSAGRVSSS